MRLFTGLLRPFLFGNCQTRDFTTLKRKRQPPGAPVVSGSVTLHPVRLWKERRFKNVGQTARYNAGMMVKFLPNVACAEKAPAAREFDSENLKKP